MSGYSRLWWLCHYIIDYVPVQHNYFPKAVDKYHMASNNSVVCLACGNPAVSGDRRVIGQSGQDSNITNV